MLRRIYLTNGTRSAVYTVIAKGMHVILSLFEVAVKRYTWASIEVSTTCTNSQICKQTSTETRTTASLSSISGTPMPNLVRVQLQSGDIIVINLVVKILRHPELLLLDQAVLNEVEPLAT